MQLGRGQSEGAVGVASRQWEEGTGSVGSSGSGQWKEPAGSGRRVQEVGGGAVGVGSGRSLQAVRGGYRKCGGQREWAVGGACRQ